MQFEPSLSPAEAFCLRGIFLLLLPLQTQTRAQAFNAVRARVSFTAGDARDPVTPLFLVLELAKGPIRDEVRHARRESSSKHAPCVRGVAKLFRASATAQAAPLHFTGGAQGRLNAQRCCNKPQRRRDLSHLHRTKGAGGLVSVANKRNLC